MTHKITNIVVSGVGGQGVLLTSELIGTAAMLAGLDARVTETHGVSQRGGSIISFVRLGEEVHSPIVEEGAADYIISMELLEGLRSVPFAGRKCVHIASLHGIPPVTVISGKAKYPPVEEIRSNISTNSARAFFLDAVERATQVGNPLHQNVVMLGFFAKISEGLIDTKFYEESMTHLLPSGAVEQNLIAFKSGEEAAEQALHQEPLRT